MLEKIPVVGVVGKQVILRLTQSSRAGTRTELSNNMEGLHAQMKQSEDIIEKLNEVDRKFEKVIEIEKEIYNRDSEMSNLLERVDAVEKKLQEKDKFIDEVDRKFEKVIEIEK